MSGERVPEGQRRTRVRVYHTLRTAHLERALTWEQADIIYRRQRYDFDDVLAQEVGAECRSDLATAFLVARRRYRQIEVNEPVALETVRRTAAVMIVVKLRDLFSRTESAFVAYAIGNVAPAELPSRRGKARLGRLLDRWLSKRVWLRLDRIAFGTEAARRTYENSMPHSTRAQATLIWALPSPCTCEPVELAHAPSLLFLGDLSGRKGFDHVLEAWPEVRRSVHGVTLTVVGTGALLDEARQLARADPRVRLLVKLDRPAIHRELAKASVLVLPSQPTPNWKEQVGLPIVEGLAHGCTVVTTEETGIAGWLVGQGHVTLPAQLTRAVLAPALARALHHPLDPAQVRASLPMQDGRAAADEWLFLPAEARPAG